MCSVCRNIRMCTNYSLRICMVMAIQSFSSRDFTRDISTAKRATAQGAVFITNRGKPTYALLKIEDYFALTGQKQPSLLDVMDALPTPVDVACAFEPLPANIVLQVPDLQ